MKHDFQNYKIIDSSFITHKIHKFQYFLIISIIKYTFIVVVFLKLILDDNLC